MTSGMIMVHLRIFRFWGGGVSRIYQSQVHQPLRRRMIQRGSQELDEGRSSVVSSLQGGEGSQVTPRG